MLCCITSWALVLFGLTMTYYHVAILVAAIGLLKYFFHSRLISFFLYNFEKIYTPLLRERKRKHFQSLHELAEKKTSIRILEIGVGTGANFEYYPKNAKVTAVDANPLMQQYFEKNLKAHPGLQLEKFVVSAAENMVDVGDDTYDAVVSTLVLCCCDRDAVVNHVRRVLAPGGVYYFWEHSVDCAGSVRRVIQQLLDTLYIWPTLFTGCHVSRDHIQFLGRAGFSSVTGDDFHIPDIGSLVWWGVFNLCWAGIRSHQCGKAVK